MRVAIAVLITVGVLALPASAAGVDPRTLVLAQTDVPRYYLFDEDNSALFTRAMVKGQRDDASKALIRAGFVSLYAARYQNTTPPHWRYITSVVYVFEQKAGAATYLRQLVKLARAEGTGAVRRVRLGDEGWAIAVRHPPDTGSVVLWRYRRVIAMVNAFEMKRHDELAFSQARKQQQRLVAALG